MERLPCKLQLFMERRITEMENIKIAMTGYIGRKKWKASDRCRIYIALLLLQWQVRVLRKNTMDYNQWYSEAGLFI